MKHVLLLLSLLAVLLISAAQPAWSQQVTAAITGQVTDPSGAPIAGSAITARDVARGTIWTATTNAEGIYNLPRLPIGSYEVRVEAQGFQTAMRPAVQLVLNQTARMDFQMKVGQLSETVEVHAAEPLLQTDTTQLGTVIESKTMTDLPLASRNYGQLTLLAPGAVAPNPSGFTSGITAGLDVGGSGAERPYINGNHEQANNYLLDGLDNNQVSDNLQGYTPNADAIAEFNMITQNASAEFGNFQGGIINATIKSGTNQLHGDLFEFFRNDKLNANSWENNWHPDASGNAAPRSTLRWNQFGGVIGGPIKKDKLFFFADYQGQRLHTPSSVAFVSVMTEAERNGDFSALLHASTPYQLKDPHTGEIFANNQIPASMMNKVAQGLFSSGKYPLPNAPGMDDGLSSNYSYAVGSYNDADQGDVKIDYNISEKDRLFGRYSRVFIDNQNTTTFPLNFNGFAKDYGHHGVANWTHMITSSIVNEARAGVNYLLPANGQVPQSGIGDLGEQIGIPNSNIGGPGLLYLNFTNGYAAGLGNTTSGTAQMFGSTVAQLDDSLVITKGRHTIKTGFQFMRQRINAYYASNNGNIGYMQFNGQYTGAAEADFFLGLPNGYGGGSPNNGTWGQRASIISGFVQDDFRIAKNLTLNLGLRYENHTPWVEVKDRQANFDLVTGKLYLAGQPCPYSNCRALYNSYNSGVDFQPRIGIAWTPKALGGNTVVRAAYSLSSFLEGTGTNLRLTMNPPARPSDFSVNYPTTQPLPTTTADQGLIAPPPTDPFQGSDLRIWDPHYRPAAVQQWNFTVQQQFSNSLTLTAGYVGQHGTHLMEPMNYGQKILNADGTLSPSPYLTGNPDIDGHGWLKGSSPAGSQRYNALQATLQKRYSNGLQLQVAYTYSKCMSDNAGYYGYWGASQAYFGNTYWQNLYDSKGEWGPCFFDQTHGLTTYALYEVPFGKGRQYGKSVNPVVNAVAGGWNVSGILTVHGGFPMTPYTWADTSGTGMIMPMRANCVAPIRTVNSPFSGGGIQWWDPSSFQMPANGTFGSCGNDVARGPGLKQLDLSLQKDFPFTESKKLQFRTDFLNSTNTPIFNIPNLGLGGGLGVISSSQGARNIQLALKFYF
jgi:hypothetical protein